MTHPTRFAIAIVLALTSLTTAQNAPRVAFKPDEEKGTVQVLVDGKEALVWRYGKDWDLPHYFPVNSPSGKPLTIQRTDPYPHHRSFWFADTVQLDGGRKISFYNALYTGVPAPKPAPDAPKDAPKQYPAPPYKDTIRQTQCTTSVEGAAGVMKYKLTWEADLGKTPVLDEAREVRIIPLGNGEYFLDMKFTLTASYGDVTFASDAVHYGWPFIRIAPDFTPTKGGTLTNSEGATGQANTNMKPAKWVDYSNAVEGVTEGLAMFSHADNPAPHKWLTRDYGTFGARRIDEKSGKPFTLKKGESISTRAGVLIHKGDVKAARVAERYQQWLDGKLQ